MLFYRRWRHEPGDRDRAGAGVCCRRRRIGLLPIWPKCRCAPNGWARSSRELSGSPGPIWGTGHLPLEPCTTSSRSDNGTLRCSSLAAAGQHDSERQPISVPAASVSNSWPPLVTRAIWWPKRGCGYVSMAPTWGWVAMTLESRRVRPEYRCWGAVTAGVAPFTK